MQPCYHSPGTCLCHWRGSEEAQQVHPDGEYCSICYSPEENIIVGARVTPKSPYTLTAYRVRPEEVPGGPVLNILQYHSLCQDHRPGDLHQLLLHSSPHYPTCCLPARRVSLPISSSSIGEVSLIVRASLLLLFRPSFADYKDDVRPRDVPVWRQRFASFCDLRVARLLFLFDPPRDTEIERWQRL